MKIYCSCCDKVQPVRIDDCRDAKTNEPYQDIVCAQCDLVIASGTDIAPPEFVTHTVEQPDDWSEWVCPDPKGYLMKCCDCGLVHEAEFGVVRYKSETEREDCDMVDDPNLQAVFRMRRSEKWSPEDTAYRPGGLAQPEQEPVAFYVYKPTLPRGHLGNVSDGDLPWVYDQDPSSGYLARMLVYTAPPQRTWVGLTSVDWNDFNAVKRNDAQYVAAWAEAKLKEKNHG